MCVNLIPGHTYYEHSVLAKNRVWQKWYQSRVDCRNASLVRRVIFYWLFSTKTIFSPSLFKTSSLLVILFTILLFLAPMLWKKVSLTFSKSSKKHFWHLQVYISVSKLLNEVWRSNEGHAKDEASLSSRLEDTFRWRDRRVAPSSPPCRMTVHRQSTSFPTMMVTRSSRSWIEVFFSLASFLVKLGE
jgi:hypothetical protein